MGETLAQRLRGMGLTVHHDLTSHAPHDDAAYRRSRRTAVELLKKGAAALFDIHRDGVPDPVFYERTIHSQKVTSLRFVVGRENQNMQSNLDFAKRLKAEADSRHPGLIKGIFLGAGDYNQDLCPRSALLEVGTYTNTLEEAQRGIALFADVVPPVLGIPVQPAAAQTPSTKADWKGIFYILLALLLGGGIYLLIASGGWDKAWERLRHFTTVEWGDIWGLQGRKPLPRREDRSPEGEEQKNEGE